MVGLFHHPDRHLDLICSTGHCISGSGRRVGEEGRGGRERREGEEGGRGAGGRERRRERRGRRGRREGEGGGITTNTNDGTPILQTNTPDKRQVLEHQGDLSDPVCVCVCV